MKKIFIFIFSGLFPLSVFAYANEESAIDKYGREKVEEFIITTVDKAVGRTPVSSLDLEYEPKIQQLLKQRRELMRYRDRLAKTRNNEAIIDQINKDYNRVNEDFNLLREEKRQKYKFIIVSDFSRSMKNLGDQELLENYRKDLPDIDKLHQGLEILACAEIVSVFEKEKEIDLNNGWGWSGSQYEVLGLKETTEYLVASHNKKLSFEYTSLIIPSQITLSTPYYKFLDRIINLKSLVGEYAKYYENDLEVQETLRRHMSSICLPHAKHVKKYFEN